MPKAYIDIEGKQFYGYDIYSDYYSDMSFYNAVLSRATYDKLSDISSFVDINARPAKGTELYVAPHCPIATENIRANYTIKRGIDNGKYNVISNTMSKKSRRCYSCSVFAVIPTRKTALTFTRLKSAAEYYSKAKELFPDITLEEINQIEVFDERPGWTTFSIINLDEIHFKLLNGEVKNPCVLTSQLDLNTDNKLSVDVLHVWFRSAMAENTLSNEDNFITETNALNQYDWRMFPGTLSTLASLIMQNTNSVGSRLYYSKSRLNKVCKEILSCKNKLFLDSNDRALCFEFIDNLLGIGACKFVSLRDLFKKSHDTGINLSTILDHFDCTVRITPKQ